MGFKLCISYRSAKYFYLTVAEIYSKCYWYFKKYHFWKDDTWCHSTKCALRKTASIKMFPIKCHIFQIQYSPVNHPRRSCFVNRPPCVNFINILRTNFLYKCCFWQLFSCYMYVEKAAETTRLNVRPKWLDNSTFWTYIEAIYVDIKSLCPSALKTPVLAG